MKICVDSPGCVGVGVWEGGGAIRGGGMVLSPS